MRNMRCVLKRLLKLREDGPLEGKGWIHFLELAGYNGHAHLTPNTTYVKKARFLLSFDAASFVNTAYGPNLCIQHI